MRIVFVRYREEDDGAWIATAPVVPGFYAYGDSYEEARSRVEDGLPVFEDEPDVLIGHLTGGRPVVTGNTRNLRTPVCITRKSEPRLGFFRDYSDKVAQPA